MNKKLTFKNFEIVYNSQIVNKEICKKKDNLFVSLTLSFFMLFCVFVLLIYYLYNNNILNLSLIAFGVFTIFTPLILLDIIYKKNKDVILFMEKSYKFEYLYVGYMDEKYVIKKRLFNHPNFQYQSMESFLYPLRKHLKIIDQAEHNKEIKVVLDISSINDYTLIIQNR